MTKLFITIENDKTIYIKGNSEGLLELSRLLKELAKANFDGTHATLDTDGARILTEDGSILTIIEKNNKL